MFSSHSKRAYQQIDDDFDDEVLRNSTCTSRFSSLFGGNFNNGSRVENGAAGEHQNLIASSSSHHSYHDSPIDPPLDPQYEQFAVHAGPPTMASSSQLGSRRWDHIGNLDEFFTHIYEYHQNGGFVCIVLQKVFSLLQFIFVMSFTTFFTQCVNYPFLFANTNVTSHGVVNIGKRHFSDAIVENCASHWSIWVIFAILAAVVYWITRVIKHAQYILKMTEIQQFYQHELKILDEQLPNLTWHSVVKRICEVQKKLRLSIHTDNITSIYIYHRILRYRNYMIGMVNKRVLYPVFDVPFLGPIAYLPNNLKHEIERILFTSSTAAWTNGPNLREEYKNHEMLEMAAKKMKEDCKFYGFLSLILMPLILPFQIMESFFSLTDLIKRRPDGLGMRRYSNYGRYLVRHFNELDHELSARLNRSHIYAAAYMDQFFSPVLEIVAKNVTFIAAAVVGILTVLSAWDEDVLQVEHVITVITVCGVIILICRGMIPDENLVWQPEILMTHVTSELHYLPSNWKGKAHTAEVRHEFDQLFQMKWMFFLMELTSPIFTPFVLLLWLKPRCSQLAAFFHDYTERVDGLGDVCSFATMDVKKHGDPKWNLDILEDNQVKVTAHNRARDGKTELSILHFKTTNPEWQPPKASETFLKKFRSKLNQDASVVMMMQSTVNYGANLNSRHPMIGDGLHRIDGPLASVYQPGNTQNLNSRGINESLSNSLRASGVDIDGAGAEMRINALFLRGLHDESVVQSSRNYGTTAMQSVFAMPDGFGRLPEESQLIDVEMSNIHRTSTSHQQSAAPEEPEHHPEALEELKELPGPSGTSRFQHRQIDEEEEGNEEEEEDNTPPLSFSS